MSPQALGNCNFCFYLIIFRQFVDKINQLIKEIAVCRTQNKLCSKLPTGSFCGVYTGSVHQFIGPDLISPEWHEEADRNNIQDEETHVWSSAFIKPGS